MAVSRKTSQLATRLKLPAKLPSPVKRKPAPAIAAGQLNPDPQTHQRLVREAEQYRGNVPLKHFIGWILLVLLGLAAVGLLTAQLLVSQRQNQLIEETASRVDLQGQSRARLVGEWLHGLETLGDNVAGAQLVRLYMADQAHHGGVVAPGAEPGLNGALSADQRLTAGDQAAAETPGGGVGGGMRAALAAQTPYMQQLLADFVGRNHIDGAALLTPQGRPLLSQGVLPDNLAVLQEGIAKVLRTHTGAVLPLRLGKDAVVMDVLRPVYSGSVAPQSGADAGMAFPDPGAEPGEASSTTPGAAPAVGGGSVVGVLWFSLPVGDRLADLLATTNLDRPGERSALIQTSMPVAAEGATASAAVVGRTALAPLGTAFEDFREGLASGRELSLSVVDGKATFATLVPVRNTPFYVLEEYRAANALALMNYYKPGLYLIVSLGVIVLAAFMLAMTVHLMAQRNKVRVKLLGQTMDALVRAVEARDPHLAGHHDRVARLSIAVANKMNLPVGERATLFYAGQLSAVGRLLVPRDVLAKTGKLTPQERKAVETDIAKATNVLEGLDFDLPIVPVIAQMYERVDGSGHPSGLKGQEISRMSRVLGAVDAYVALTANRSFRQAMSEPAAYKVLSEGGRFDQDVLNALQGLRSR